MFSFKRKKKQFDIDEIFLDAVNISEFNQGRLEGKLELPLTTRNIYVVAVIFVLIAVWFLHKLFLLQIVDGQEYRERSDRNRINQDVIIAERGVVYDRYGELLAWNEIDYSDKNPFPFRAYTDRSGLGQVVGYVSYPLKDSKGIYYRTEYLGRSGIESSFNDSLAGQNGKRLIEVDAVGSILSEHAIESPQAGAELKLSVDAALSEAMYKIISTSSIQAGIRSGAAAIMDVTTGEIIGLTSYPSYDPEVMADGDDIALIDSYNSDDRFPFLNKVVGGAYTPGSIVKPFVAYGALAEKIISPEKVIVSNGELIIPNPYVPSNPSIFRDWRAHGAMTMREAIAFSSNVYFYIIGGGFGDQPGLGITKLASYYRLFGLGSKTGVNLANEQSGVVPDPKWKDDNFHDDWRLGDTYYTAIGQYGFLTTPIQMLAAYGALANGGKLFTPHLIYGETGSSTDLGLNKSYLQIVHDGMRKTVVMNGGTARPLEKKYVNISAKSGTAELDSSKTHLNSWVAGYWPSEEPKYAFILIMENAPYKNALGATRVMGDVMDWISVERPDYLK